MKVIRDALGFVLLPVALLAAGQAKELQPTTNAAAPVGILFHEVRYTGTLSDSEARFTVQVVFESVGKGEAVATLFEGELALVPPIKLPAGIGITRDGSRYRLAASRPGKYQLEFELLAKITPAEPWNKVEFRGPPAAIAPVRVHAVGRDTELQLLSGTVLETVQTNDSVQLKGFLGADHTVALRWQSRRAEVARKTLVTAETVSTASITPTVIKFNTQLKFDILQGKLPRLTVALPTTHALTRVAGDQIRDWQLINDGNRQLLNIEFVRPLEKSYQLTILTEQTVETTPLETLLSLPQPLEVDRESGAFSVSAEDVLVEIGPVTGLRRVNAPEGTLAAFRFSDRPVTLSLKLSRIEPVIAVADRVGIKLEDARLVVSHGLVLTVEKAGIYSLELAPDPAMTVTEVRGDGVEDWKVADGKLRVNFANRVLGTRRIEVQLEQSLEQFPERIVINPLLVTGATKQTAQIGAAPAPGIQLKTAELIGLREVPSYTLQTPVTAASVSATHADEVLAFAADGPDWKLTLTCERLSPRVVADVFNLVTIGDGLVGGSATIRYAIVNQGVQQFRLRLPAHWKNVEFIGPHIRRKEQTGASHSGGAAQKRDAEHVTWTITLQDKVWAGYTLVVTYDFQFDPAGATLRVGGIHTEDTDRETGSIAITTTANLELNVLTASEPLRRIDEADLAVADRALITRPVLLAYRYTGDDYTLAIDVKRYDEVPVLSAVADRTQLTTVLTEAGELLTQASFMVKNNAKQYQRFKLPEGATFWSCYVDNQPAKPERDGEWLLVPLPRGVNRDKPFAVDIVYAENKGAITGLTGKKVRLAAPVTDVPNTYAEWELYVPNEFRLSAFGGNMTVARGTVYSLRDAWRAFIEFYANFFRRGGAALLIGSGSMLLLIALAVTAWRRGLKTLLGCLLVLAAVAVMASMLLPSLVVSKKRAMGMSAINNLRQVATAIEQFALENQGRTPSSADELKNYLGRSGTERVLIDPRSGLPFVYVAAGVPRDMLRADSVIAYSPTDDDGRLVLYADGRIETVSREKFDQLVRRGFLVFVSEEERVRAAQVDAIRRAARTGSAGEPMEQHVVGYTVVPVRPGVALSPSPGAFGGSGGAIAAEGTAPVAAGIRPLRIDIPRAGQAFVFTKVLNVSREPLWIEAKISELKTSRRVRALGQCSAFVIGLILTLWQWRRVPRRSLPLAIGVALMLGAVCDLLLYWRTLHIAFIVIAPITVLGLIVWALQRLWRRTGPPQLEPPTSMTSAVAVCILLWVVATQLHAQTNSAQLDASIVSANYTGTVNDRIAQLDVTLRVLATSQNQSLTLFGEEVAVQQFSASAKDAKLVREGPDLRVVLPRKGEATLHLKLLVNVTGEATKRTLAFKIPDALASVVSLDIETPDAEVELPAAVWFKRTVTAQQMHVEATIGAGQRLELSWTPRMKRAAEIAATVFCQNTALVTFGAGVVNTHAVLDYQIAQGELRQLRVRLPAKHQLLRVEGEAIRSWEVKDEAGPVLVLDLIKGVTTAYRLTVETETAVGQLPSIVNVEIPHALDVKRETGQVGLRAEDELELSIHTTEGLQRVEAVEFVRGLGREVPGVINAFRFLKPEFALRVGVAAVQPQIEAQVHNHVTVGAEQVGIAATVSYTIKRAGVFALRLALPDAYRVESVSGDKILQWAERVIEGAPVLEVTLKERTVGTYRLRVALVQHFRELPRTLPIYGVHPLDAEKLTGFLSVSAESGVALKTANFSGLTEIPVGELEAAVAPAPATVSQTGQRIPIPGGSLAFKYVATEPSARVPWQLAVATELLEPWIRAEVANTVTVAETVVNCRALIRYDIQNAPVKQFAIEMPTLARNVQITGPNIRRIDHDGTLWRVELQSKVRGLYTLSISWEQPYDTKSGMIELAGVTARDVERETGYIDLVTRPPLQLAPVNVSNLLQIDVRDWPDWAGRAPEASVLVYRYLRPGYILVLKVDQLKEAEVLQALVDDLHLTTVVAEDGQMMTRMTLAVRNNARQFIEIELPGKSTDVWAAFVGGRAVRPSVRAGKLLVPLDRSGADGAPVTVELVYTGTNQWPVRRGRVAFSSPTFDLPVKTAHWEMFLPPDYDYTEFGGSMKREPKAGIERVSFSLGEYVRQESQQRAAITTRLRSELGSVKQKLAKGSVDEAYKDYARAQQVYAADEGRELKELGDELRRAQVSNLLEQQSKFVFENVEGPQQRVLATVAQQPAYDATIAEAQIAKLQQVHQAAEVRLVPLRVNLPTHGVRLNFTQVLQTQPGKPLTVEFTAVNTGVPNWLSRILLYAGCFLLIWLAVAVFVNRHKSASGRL